MNLIGFIEMLSSSSSSFSPRQSSLVTEPDASGYRNGFEKESTQFGLTKRNDEPRYIEGCW
eukprot:scaffold31452_cov48-Attheya_sp.AAC.4